MIKRSEKRKARKLSTAMIIFIILLSLLVLSAAVIGILQLTHVINLFGGKPGTSMVSKPSASAPQLDNNGNAESGTYTSGASETGSAVKITDNLTSSIQFPTGSKGTRGQWVCENIKTNKVIEQAEVYVDGQLEAESVPIKPGEYVNGITLKRALAKGNYDATVYLNYFAVNTQKYLSSSGYEIRLSVS